MPHWKSSTTTFAFLWCFTTRFFVAERAEGRPEAGAGTIL